MKPPITIIIKFLIITILISSYTYVYSQNAVVQFDSEHHRTLCPRNNGVLTASQTSSLKILGPTDKTWFASYSVDGSPAIDINEGLGIDSGTFLLEISFENNTQTPKDYLVSIEKAWLEDGSPLTISEENRTRTLRVYPPVEPNIYDYKTLIKTNSELDYRIQIGRSSSLTCKLPTGAQEMSYTSELYDRFKFIDIKIKWQDEAGVTSFKTVEKSGFGCDSDTIYNQLELKSAFSLDLGPDQNICAGEEVTITPQIDLESDYKYKWSTNETSESITVKESGVYTLAATDSKDNQEITSQVKVTVHDAPSLDIDDIIIMGTEPIGLNIQKEGCTYQWSTGETTGEVSLTNPGDYSVEIKSEHGCTNSKSFTVKDHTSLFTLSLPNIVHICANETMVLSAYTDVNQNYTYLWSTGSTEKEILIKEEGTYTLTATDPNDFSQTASSQIFYHPNPIVDLGDDLILWDGESAQLDAKNAGASYEWSTLETSQTITVNSGGNFEVKVIDQYGCSNSDGVFVDYREGEKFRVELGEDKSICQGDQVLIVPEIIGNPSLPLSYNWLGQNHTEPEIQFNKEGIYTLEVTDQQGNIESSKIQITMLPSPNVNLGKDIIDNPNETFELIANLDNVSYNWSTGEISKSIIIKESGTYWLEVIDAHQCSARDEIMVKFIDDYPFVGLPEAFSPNGDGHNDIIYVKGNDVDKIKLLIFNRLGKKVFETTDVNQGWDGYYNGQLQAMDSYYYSLKITYSNGFARTKTGKFTLLK